MDFISDALFDGKRLRLLTVIDLFTRACPVNCVGQNRHPTEVAGMLDRWVYERGIRIDFSRPGTSTDNVEVESFNGKLRQECLNENWFMLLEDAQCKIEAWRILYNQRRPHSALGWMTSSEFAEKSAGC